MPADTVIMITPQIIAHRGYAAAYPENSLPAFQAAIDLGIRWLECDLQMTADGVPVIVHDGNLERVAGQSIDVLSTTSAEVLKCSLGENIFPPTLDQLLALLAAYPDVSLFLEFKTESLEKFGLKNVFDQAWSALGNLRGRVIPISSSERLSDYARRQGAAAIGWVAARWDEEHHEVAARLQPDFLFTNWKRLPDSQPLWEGPWQWAVYEVVDPEVAERLVARGIYFIESMDPQALIHRAPFLEPGDV